MDQLSNQIDALKCLFGFHVQGNFSRETTRFFHHRVYHFCSKCGREYQSSKTRVKPFGG